MRWVGEALRGAWTALAAHPIVFASVSASAAGGGQCTAEVWRGPRRRYSESPAARAASRAGGPGPRASRRSPSSSCLFSPPVTSGAVHALQEKMAENDCLELEARHDRIA